MLCTFVVFDFIHPIAYSICELVSFRNLLLTSSAGYLLDATTISLFLHNTVSKIRSKMPLSNSLSNGYLSNRISRSILSLISSAYACTSDPISSFPDKIRFSITQLSIIYIILISVNIFHFWKCNFFTSRYDIFTLQDM